MTPRVKAALAELTAALAESDRRASVEPGPGVGTPDPQPQGQPWYRDTTSAPPVAPLNDVANVAEIQRYMAHGYRTNFARGVAEQDWQAALVKADDISAGVSDIGGVFNFDKDTAINLVLGGGTQGGGVMGPEVIYAPAGLDFVASAAWLAALPGIPGPSGQ